MQTIKTKKKLKRDWVMIAQFLNIIYLASVHEVTHVNPVFLASVKPYPPPPPKLKRKRGNIYANLTQIVLRDVIFFFLCNKIYYHFSLVNPFSYSFVNSDWRELVIYFYTNEQDVKQNAFIVNFSDNSSHRRPSALS